MHSGQSDRASVSFSMPTLNLKGTHMLMEEESTSRQMTDR
jgi:hypothetical protein